MFFNTKISVISVFFCQMIAIIEIKRTFTFCINQKGQHGFRIDF